MTIVSLTGSEERQKSLVSAGVEVGERLWECCQPGHFKNWRRGGELMNVSDPDTWPKRPTLSYWRLSHAHPTAHAFYNWNAALTNLRAYCGAICREPAKAMLLTEGYGRLCNKCIAALRTWRILA